MSAARAVKQFRLNELKALPAHIIRFGPLPSASETGSSAGLRLPNPFVPRRNPSTGRWAPPKISLRRQADLIKRAKEANMLHLLPPGPKCPHPTEHPLRAALPETDVKFDTSTKGNKDELDGVWMDNVEWDGKAEFKQTVGSDTGTRLYSGKKRMFKGHKWERKKGGRDMKRKVLMRDMARRIRNYKAVSLLLGFESFTFVNHSFLVLPEAKTKPTEAF